MRGLIHRHLHKRKLQARLTNPSPWTNILDKATLLAGVIGPAMTIPQIVKIYAAHNASGVSALSWFAFALLDVPFVLYGMAHKDKPIVITYTLWLAANLIVGIGAVIYR